MSSPDGSVLARLLAATIGRRAAEEALAPLKIDPAVTSDAGVTASRSTVAMALNVLLFADLLARVPTGRAYVEDVRRAGGRVTFDHGALRTIKFAAGPTGALPPGHRAFRRLLEPLGYAQSGVYPLPRLSMTGYVFTHQDHPETLPQFFVSELEVEKFSTKFGEAAARVFASASDPIGADERRLLAMLSQNRRVEVPLAAAGLPGLIAAFGRRHTTPALLDYEALLAESAEAAWIATEGSAFNHATDRVPDLVALTREQAALGRAIKPEIEVSRNGRVRQTAFKADPVRRTFVGPDGAVVERVVPGSFYEFIARDPVGPGGPLDLTFDSANATAIFRMTDVA